MACVLFLIFSTISLYYEGLILVFFCCCFAMKCWAIGEGLQISRSFQSWKGIFDSMPNGYARLLVYVLFSRQTPLRGHKNVTNISHQLNFGGLNRPYTLQLKKGTQMCLQILQFCTLWFQSSSYFIMQLIFKKCQQKHCIEIALLFTRMCNVSHTSCGNSQLSYRNTFSYIYVDKLYKQKKEWDDRRVTCHCLEWWARAWSGWSSSTHPFVNSFRSQSINTCKIFFLNDD